MESQVAKPLLVASLGDLVTDPMALRHGVSGCEAPTMCYSIA